MKRVKVGDRPGQHVIAEAPHISPEDLEPSASGDYVDDGGDVMPFSDLVPGAADLAEDESRGDALFPEGYLEPLRGLMFLGYMEDEVEYAGHTFLIRTLTEGEILRIGQLMKAYRGSVTEAESRKMYTVAACMMNVDGEPVYRPYNEEYDLIYEKAQVIKRWFPAVVNAVYNAYLELEGTAIAVSDALKKS